MPRWTFANKALLNQGIEIWCAQKIVVNDILFPEGRLGEIFVKSSRFLYPLYRHALRKPLW